MPDNTEAASPRWRPLERNQRRVAGVLAEKAKTTPENYPLSLNSLVNGCNQKSNRFPQMALSEDQVSDALDTLRHAGAVALIQGDGRVEKFRHLLYDWLGVDKAELAVMTELMLRGAQTLGELRGRAARMEPIKDIGDLLPIVDRLREKNLVIYLTPPGRGATVTHNLYEPQELAKVRSEHGAATDSSLPAPVVGPGSSSGPPAAAPPSSVPGSTASTARSVAPTAAAEGGEVAQLRSELGALQRQVAELREQSETAAAQLRQELDDLKRQLGN